jgi:hypothetical protein
VIEYVHLVGRLITDLKGTLYSLELHEQVELKLSLVDTEILSKHLMEEEMRWAKKRKEWQKK